MSLTRESRKNPAPVVIIGAGFAGINSLKVCLENGLDAVVFERAENFGGLWRYRDQDEHGMASVQKTTIINTSKEMNAFSDYPPPPEFANYMHNSKMLEYLASYIKHFKLESYIRYQHDVLQVEKHEEYDINGQWKVNVKSKDGEVQCLDASAVFVCIGHHVYPNMPEFPGLSEFRGKVMHSHSFKHASQFDGCKACLVVGVGNSGMDVATDLSFVTSKVYLGTRRGAWLVKRMGEGGLPWDFQTNRWNAFLASNFPNYHLNTVEKAANKYFDHAMYGLKPAHRFNAQHPTLGDFLPSRIMSGVVEVKGDVSHFTPTGVVFKGQEDKEYAIDSVVFATGYEVGFPFLGDLLRVEKNKVDLYLRVFPPQLKHPTLAIIGLIQPIGPIFPVAELQARWAAKLVKGDCKLPPIPDRWKEIKEYRTALEARYVESNRHTFEVDMVPYMDDLAVEIGCKPNLWKTFFTDQALFYRLLFGPAVAYQYRLTGPDVWSGARDAIMKVEERMVMGFDSKYKDQVLNQLGRPPHFFGAYAALLLVLLALFLSFQF